MLEWLDEHLERPVTVEQLANLVALSPRTLARRFRDATGTTPMRWLTHRRVERARHLRVATDLPVETIAHRTGMATAANLRQHFRAATGVSPVAYRRRYREPGLSSAGTSPESMRGGRRQVSLPELDADMGGDREVRPRPSTADGSASAAAAVGEPAVEGVHMMPRIKVITLGVDDLEASLAFYRDGLGLPTEGIVGTDFEDGAVVFFEMNHDLLLALYPRAALAKDAGIPAEPPSATEFTIGHVVGSKQHVDAIMEQAAAAGARVTDPAHDRFWGGYSGYFQDPDGHLWEIAWNPAWQVND